MVWYAEQQSTLTRPAEGTKGLLPDFTYRASRSICVPTSAGCFFGDLTMKTCSKCKQPKLLSEFHKDQSKKDGHKAHCKSCQKITDVNYQQSEKGKARIKRYNQSKKGKVAHKRYHQTEKGKTTRRAIEKRFNARHPEQIRAKWAVHSAVRTAKLPRANTFQCSCGKQAKDYHHWSYLFEHQLDVEPMCCDCHKRLHRRIAI